MLKAWNGITDTTAFTRDAEAFLCGRLDEQGDIFEGQILHMNVVFAATHASVQTVLEEEEVFSRKRGYGAFTGLNLFGPAVLFCDGEAHRELRARLERCSFASATGLKMSGLQEVTQDLVQSRMLSLKQDASGSGTDCAEVQMYKVVKDLCSSILYRIFLTSLNNQGSSGDATVEETKGVTLDEFRKLHSTLWRGTVSSGVKFNVDLGFTKKQSAFSKANEAREALLGHFNHSWEKAGVSPKSADDSSRCPFKGFEGTPKERNEHLMMFSSSMVVKAISSIVTSFVLTLDQNPELMMQLRSAEDKPGGLLDHVLLEIERLFPPVIGCCRTVSSLDGVELGGKRLKQGQRVWCSFISANRDPAVFSNPATFDPGRWARTETNRKHFSFGASHSSCIGAPLARMMGRIICGALLEHFDSWKVLSESKNFRWLPVARPVDGLSTRLQFARNTK